MNKKDLNAQTEAALAQLEKAKEAMAEAFIQLVRKHSNDPRPRATHTYRYYDLADRVDQVAAERYFGSTTEEYRQAAVFFGMDSAVPGGDHTLYRMRKYKRLVYAPWSAGKNPDCSADFWV